MAARTLTASSVIARAPMLAGSNRADRLRGPSSDRHGKLAPRVPRARPDLTLSTQPAPDVRPCRRSRPLAGATRPRRRRWHSGRAVPSKRRRRCCAGTTRLAGVAVAAGIPLDLLGDDDTARVPLSPAIAAGASRAPLDLGVAVGGRSIWPASLLPRASRSICLATLTPRACHSAQPSPPVPHARRSIWVSQSRRPVAGTASWLRGCRNRNRVVRH